MSVPVRWHPGASLDLQEAIKYYQTCVEGLDVRFLAHVDAAVARAASAPRLAHCFDGPFRKVRLERFPYAMIYREKGEGIEIMATAHGSREPGYWKDRMQA